MPRVGGAAFSLPSSIKVTSRNGGVDQRKSPSWHARIGSLVLIRLRAIKPVAAL
jgi:hypothetical protein